MSHSLERKTRLHLFEEDGTSGGAPHPRHGDDDRHRPRLRHRGPSDPDVPEAGDEPAAGCALRNLGRQLPDIAERDAGSVDARSGTDAGPVLGRPGPVLSRYL